MEIDRKRTSLARKIYRWWIIMKLYLCSFHEIIFVFISFHFVLLFDFIDVMMEDQHNQTYTQDHGNNGFHSLHWVDV